jgi:hypothetical protein
MPINRLTPDSAIDNYIAELIARKERAIIHQLSYVGTRCVNEARTGGSYTDRSGNLRSSTGFVIVVDGNIVRMSNFEQVKQGGKGSADGKAFAAALTGKFPKGICLIVVAGMKYASYVSAKGYNVLDSAELLAGELVPKMLGQLGFKKK